jgi:hypothetical protein
MPENRKPITPAAAVIQRKAPVAPGAVKIVQGKLAPLPPCSCGGKPAPIQMAKKKKTQKKADTLYEQAGRNWDNYACYESGYARTIERFFLNTTTAEKVRDAIVRYMVARDLGGGDSFPGHCSATSASKQNSGSKEVIDKIHKVFEGYIAKKEREMFY